MVEEKMSKQEQIGYHKGSINTLVAERNELLRIVSVTESLIQAHAKELEKLGVKLNKDGEIITDYKNSETNILGVYAAGDVIEKKFKQAITGASEGCIAAGSAYNYLKNNFHHIFLYQDLLLRLR